MFCMIVVEDDFVHARAVWTAAPSAAINLHLCRLLTGCRDQSRTTAEAGHFLQSFSPSSVLPFFSFEVFQSEVLQQRRTVFPLIWGQFSSISVLYMADKLLIFIFFFPIQSFQQTIKECYK